MKHSKKLDKERRHKMWGLYIASGCHHLGSFETFARYVVASLRGEHDAFRSMPKSMVDALVAYEIDWDN